MGIDRQQALECFESNDLIGLGMEADAARHQLHPEDAATYVLEHSLVCAAATNEDLDAACRQARTAEEHGATGLAIRATGLTLDSCHLLLTRLSRTSAGLWLEGPTATELLALIGSASPDAVRDSLLRLRDAGLDSLAGHDAPSHSSAAFADWSAVHRIAHAIGIPSTAAMTFGAGESAAERVEHLEALHQLQQTTGGFTAFRPIAAQPPPGARELDGPTAVESLKTIAISRMMLDNIPHLDASSATGSLKILQMALRFGADDAGAAAIAHHPAAPATPHAHNRPAEEDLRRIIRDAGFLPVQRDIPYRTAYLS